MINLSLWCDKKDICLIFARILTFSIYFLICYYSTSSPIPPAPLFVLNCMSTVIFFLYILLILFVLSYLDFLPCWLLVKRYFPSMCRKRKAERTYRKLETSRNRLRQLEKIYRDMTTQVLTFCIVLLWTYES